MYKSINQLNINGKLISVDRPIIFKNMHEQTMSPDHWDTDSVVVKSYVEFQINKDNVGAIKNEIENLRFNHPDVFVWIKGENFDSIPNTFWHLIDFFVPQINPKAMIVNQNDFKFSCPIGIPITLNQYLKNDSTVSSFIIADLFDDIMIKRNNWVENGVYDSFLELDMERENGELQILSFLQKLKVLKHIEIPISAKINGSKSSVGIYNTRKLIMSLLDIGCNMIRI